MQAKFIIGTRAKIVQSATFLPFSFAKRWAGIAISSDIKIRGKKVISMLGALFSTVDYLVQRVKEVYDEAAICTTSAKNNRLRKDTRLP